jgi:hypothetical protein
MTRLIPLAAALVVVAGCGSATAGGPGSPDGAASLVPADAVAFVAAGTDVPSEWQPLLDRVKWAADVRPALGDELDAAVLAGGQVVALTQPRDESKLAALAAKARLEMRRIGDWTALAKTAAALDALAQRSAGTLADNNVFLAAMDSLPGDALVRAYANGPQAEKLLTALPGQMQTSIVPLGTPYQLAKRRSSRPTAGAFGWTEVRWGAAALTQEKGGLKLDAVVRTGRLLSPGPPRAVLEPTPPYVPGLVEEIPADALAVVDFPVPSGAFETLPKLPPQLERLLGPTDGLAAQLDAVLRGESALYVRAGLPLPEVTLVTQPADTAVASSTLDAILKSLPAASMLGKVELHRAVIGGQFVVSTSQRGIDDFRGAGPKLSADPAFLKAKELSGMPAETTGFAYANLKAALPLLRLAGVEVPAGLPDLRSVLAYGGQGTNERTFTTFVQVGSS